MELGSHGELDYLLLQISTVTFRTLAVFVTLLRTAVETAMTAISTANYSRSTQAAWHWRGPHLLNIVVLALADGLFGLCGSELLDELLVSTRSPSLISLMVSVDVKHHVLVCFSAVADFSDTVFVSLLRTAAVERASCGGHKLLRHWLGPLLFSIYCSDRT